MSLGKLAREWLAEALAAQGTSELLLERSTTSRTGFKNVKLIKGKYYQAQLHVSKKGGKAGGNDAGGNGRPKKAGARRRRRRGGRGRGRGPRPSGASPTTE